MARDLAGKALYITQTSIPVYNVTARVIYPCDWLLVAAEPMAE